MKKLLTLLLLSTSISAFAHGPNYGFRPRHYHDNWGWVAPVIVGGVVGYEIARNQPVIVQQPPVIQQQPVIIQQQPYYGQSQICSEWKEIQMPDGRIYRERTCTQ